MKINDKSDFIKEKSLTEKLNQKIKNLIDECENKTKELDSIKNVNEAELEYLRNALKSSPTGAETLTLIENLKVLHQQTRSELIIRTQQLKSTTKEVHILKEKILMQDTKTQQVAVKT